MSEPVKKCAKCQREKPVSRFQRDSRRRFGVKSRCKECSAVDGAFYRETHAEQIQAGRKTRRGRDRITERVRRYDLSAEEQAVLHAGTCAICGADESKGVLQLDHDHATGAVRGFLCAHCNRALGSFQDDPAILIAALAYLVGSLAPLERLRLAASVRETAREEYRAALLAARESGFTFTEIAGELGVSRQAVRQLYLELVKQACKHPPERLHAWTADDGAQCVACNECGAVLAGAA